MAPSPPLRYHWNKWKFRKFVPIKFDSNKCFLCSFAFFLGKKNQTFLLRKQRSAHWQHNGILWFLQQGGFSEIIQFYSSQKMKWCLGWAQLVSGYQSHPLPRGAWEMPGRPTYCDAPSPWLTLCPLSLCCTCVHKSCQAWRSGAAVVQWISGCPQGCEVDLCLFSGGHLFFATSTPPCPDNSWKEPFCKNGLKCQKQTGQ